MDPALEMRRRAVVLTLARFGEGGTLNERIVEESRRLPRRAQGFFRHLVLGVVRHRATLDRVLEEVSGRARREQPPVPWEILRHGAFQMLLMGGVPDHAVVSQCVDLARSDEGGVRAGGFVNGVLRGLQRARVGVVELSGEREGRSPSLGEPAPPSPRRAIPLPDRPGVVMLDRDVLPDPERQPDSYLAAAYSYPLWLARRRLSGLGFPGAVRVLAAGNATPPIAIRVNRLRSTEEEVRASLEADRVRIEPGAVPGALRISRGGDPGRLDAVRRGFVSIQDESAQEAAPLLAPRAGEAVLDLCAAPGGKTVHCADLMGNEGRILALDRSPGGTVKVRETCERLGVKIAEARCADAASPDAAALLPAGSYDRVLLDAPCSNTGVLRRRVEARWRAGPDGIRELARGQESLLAVAARAARRGGRVLYSVCSIEPEEGPGTASLAAAMGLRLLEERFRLPATTDGGYLALFERQ
ncbi:MAG: hypothetical protein L0216_00205 [Planctomycetales bacterium]|nr:hypothetical protein [Planctomycetales bacterium]